MFKIYGTGNLTKDPEKLNIEKDACKFTIAVNETYTREDGTRPVQYFNVVAWGKLAENCLKYLKKGSKISLYGNPQNRSYEKDGETKYIFEIVATDIEFIGTPKAKEEKVEQKPELEPIQDDFLPF